MSTIAREALRQQMLLRALLGDARPAVVGGWLRDGPRFARGLATYRANSGALAEHALAAAFPTVQQLLGEESFAALARAFWQRLPPQAGDIGLWGDRLAGFVADAESLASKPYLADVVRLEWAVHLAERAADVDAASGPTGLDLLAQADPDALRLHLAPGVAVLSSSHPVASIWHAHRRSDAQRFDAVRAAFAAGRGEQALVERQGWQARVTLLEDAPARFTTALLAGTVLSQALEGAGPDFEFEPWLIAALQQQRLVAVTVIPSQEKP